MKILMALMFTLSLQSAFARVEINQNANLISREEVNALGNSVDRILPEFKAFQKSLTGNKSYSLYLSNACSKEIVAYVKYLSVDGKWMEAGFWKLATTKETYVGETRNAYYYPGAYSSDGTLGWGDIPVVFKGYDLFVSERKIDSNEWGDWVHVYSCDK